MFNKDDYVIYETNDDHVLLYNKYTKRMTSLVKGQFRLLMLYTEGKTTPDNATIDFWKSSGLLSEQSSNRCNLRTKSFYELDKKINSNSFTKTLEFILSYFAFPVWVTMFSLHYDKLFSFISNLQLKDVVYIPFVFILFIIGLLLHECSHMIVAINNGAYVPELVIGVKRHVVFYGYTRIIGIENIIKRNRIKIYYAGIAMNFLSSAFSLILYSVLSYDLCLVATLIFIFQAFANSSIFNNGDGYDMLFCIFDRIGLPRKFGPKYLRENIAKKRWVIVFPMMNMFGTIVLPALLIILRLNNYNKSLISPNAYYVCVLSIVVICFFVSFFKVKQQILLAIISIESMLLTFLAFAFFIDKIMMHTQILVLSIFFIPVIESAFHLILSVCSNIVWSYTLKIRTKT